ncbi:hypothetical protein A1O3_04634 [Capronia epimyces CBS 606.96]|uniref:Uncharacterized protein n=1 Tax=Capronia epimyces CBS 606.96 TaxID=1182542 RepID=W9XTV0_9EURO|nr:uncharacterized protein A1O3_04634 [Capronia epimyces CBS 606.96]EXJ83967.1 hypothetical protein A1O3_04634 [Capronia epimyces CBS 606.96]
MKPFSHTAMRGRGILSVATRHYTSTSRLLQPTALHRAEVAADLKAHPESQLTQEKLPDKKHSHHWEEANATESEADIKADLEAQAEKQKQETQNQKGSGQ